uniref:Uncharacterized protein n=1 Tax=Phytophthora infestans TaxID=4787 RepID=Q572L0_PHYIN|nr:hypothetical protein PI35.0120c [Phytophthora infestans]
MLPPIETVIAHRVEEKANQFAYKRRTYFNQAYGAQMVIDQSHIRIFLKKNLAGTGISSPDRRVPAIGLNTIQAGSRTPIHMRQCRSVLPPTEEEMAAAEQDKTTRRVQVPSLVDLNLVHRMVVNLVKDSKRVKAKHRAMVETFESALQRARLEIEQLECPAATASRWIEQQQHFEQRKCEVHREGISLSSVESENRRLTTAAKNAEKNKCRLEAKVHNKTTCYISFYRACNYLLFTD